MSQRALKRRVADLLAERDAAIKLIAAYDVVIADLGEPGLQLLTLKRVIAEQRRDRAQAEAESIASQLERPKMTFAGRWLRGPVYP